MKIFKNSQSKTFLFSRFNVPKRLPPMNLDQVLVEAESSNSSDLEILDDTDDVVPDTGTDNTFQEAEDAKAIEERVSTFFSPIAGKS